jgi:hypothetical protein
VSLKFSSLFVRLCVHVYTVVFSISDPILLSLGQTGAASCLHRQSVTARVLEDRYYGHGASRRTVRRA